MSFVLALITTVVANVISHYICKRLDGREKSKKVGNKPEV